MSGMTMQSTGQRMRAVCALAHPLAAHDNGIVLRARAILEALAPRWDLTCLHTGRDDDPGTAVPHVSAVGVETGLPPNLRGWSATAEPLRVELEARVRMVRPDLVLLWPGTEQTPSAAWANSVVVADRVDALSLHWRHLLPRARGVRQFVQSLREFRGYVRTERRIVNAYDLVVVAGDVDAESLRALRGTARIAVIPNGVHSDATPSFERSGRPVVALSGVLDFGPNVDAILWMVDEIWPLVRRQLPAARLRLIGRRPSSTIENLAGVPGVELHVAVPSMADALRAAHVAVAPMRSGSGIKNKILEAWGVGTPSVMTSIAVSGIVVPPVASGYVADDADGIASRIVHLLRDEPARRELAQRSWESVVVHHTWPAQAARLEALVLDNCGSHSLTECR